MNIVKIRIIGADEKTPLVENAATTAQFVATEETTFAIMDNATAGGQMGVIINLKLPDGNYAMGMLTGNNFEGVVAAYQGAKQRFGK